MTDDATARDRRIMDNIGEVRRLPVLGIRMSEVYFVGAFAVGALLVASSIDVAVLQWPIMLLGVTLGFMLAYASPTHVTTFMWVKDTYRYAKRPAWTFAASERAPGDQKNDGGLANKTVFEPAERTQDLTHVKRAWPETGAVLRTDDVMEAFVELDADNMDFAMAEDWSSKQSAGAEFANKGLDGQLKFHATTESFDIEAVVERLDSRLADPDVRERPALRVLLEEYREKRPAEMRDRGTQQVRFFLGVTVGMDEIATSHQVERSPIEKLSRLPVLGLLFSPFVTRSADLAEVERFQRALQRLDDRLAEVRNSFVQNARGLNARRLSTVELFVLNAQFWTGSEGLDRTTIREVVDASPAMDSRRRHGGDGRE